MKSAKFLHVPQANFKGMHDSGGMVWAEAVAMNIHSHVKSEFAKLSAWFLLALG